MPLSTVLQAIGSALSKVPEEAWQPLERLVAGICTCGSEAKRIAERQLAVLAADQAADAAVHKALERKG